MLALSVWLYLFESYQSFAVYANPGLGVIPRAILVEVEPSRRDTEKDIRICATGRKYYAILQFVKP